jgi:hypothetical protein
MPHNLTDVSAFSTATAPVGADIRNAASVEAVAQWAANRTRYLYDRTTALADLTALAAISAPADGLVRMVAGLGLYRFVLGSGASVASPWRVADGGATGIWFWEGESLIEPVETISVPCGLIDGISVVSSYDTRAVVTAVTDIKFKALAAADRGLYHGAFVTRVVDAAVSGAGYAYRLPLHGALRAGATLTAASIKMLPLAAAGRDGTIPSYMPRFAVVRRPIDWGAAPTVTTMTEHLASGGYAVCAETYGAYSAGDTIEWSQTLDQNNVVDLGAYSYDAYIIDESYFHAVAGNMYLGLALTMTVDGLRR